MRPTTSTVAKRHSGRSTEGTETARDATSSKDKDAVAYRTTTSTTEHDANKRGGRESMASTSEIDTIPEYKTSTGY